MKTITNLIGMLQQLRTSMFMKMCASRVGRLVLSGLNQNVLLWRSLSVTVAMAVADFIWAKYVSTIAGGASFAAANWAVLVMSFGAFVVISYVQDKRLIIPAAIGAWIGTYLGV